MHTLYKELFVFWKFSTFLLLPNILYFKEKKTHTSSQELGCISVQPF